MGLLGGSVDDDEDSRRRAVQLDDDGDGGDAAPSFFGGTDAAAVSWLPRAFSRQPDVDRRGATKPSAIVASTGISTDEWRAMAVSFRMSSGAAIALRRCRLGIGGSAVSWFPS